jgi:hypothetical protein
MPGIVGELGKGRPLDAAVVLAERMQGVDMSEEPDQPGNERVAGQAPQPLRGGQPTEHVRRVRLQVLARPRGQEQC